MLSTQLLLRAARRFHAAWPREPAGMSSALARSLDQVDWQLRLLQGLRQRLAKAVGRKLPLAAARLQADLPRHVRALAQRVAQAQTALAQPTPSVPSVNDLATELRGIEDEFGALTVHWKKRAIAATTAPIALEGVPLGPFEIRLYWDRVAQGLNVRCFAIVALEPHPAEANDAVTHPHVKRRNLCPGDAEAALAKALTEGRLADAFCLVNSVLRHYNGDSAYVRLSDWGGKDCHDCGSSVPDGEGGSCSRCQEAFCDDCLGLCAACGEYCCLGCCEPCAVCEASCCRSCLRRSSGSQRLCCPKCVKACAGCGRPVAQDERNKATGRCATCSLPSSSPSTTAPLTPEEPHAPTLATAEPPAG
jgi:hypothetical protein